MSQMNLLPDYYVKQRFRNRVDMLCVILFTLVMGGIIVVGTVQGRNYRETQSQYEAVTEQFNQETESLDEFIRLRGTKRTLHNDAKQVSDLEEAIPRSYLVAVVARSLPAKAGLSVLEISEKISVTADMTRGTKKPAKGKPQVTKSSAAQQEEAPPPRLVVSIGGYAATEADVAQIYSTLKAHPMTKDVQLRHTREYETAAGLYREFQIDWELKNGVDVLDHLTEDVGIVESPKVSGDSAEQKEAG